MKDITIIMPVHQIDDTFDEYVNKAIESVAENTKTYSEGKLITMAVCPESIENDLTDRFDLKKNKTDWNFFGYTWNKMFRRDIIEKYKIRFIEGLRISEDEVYTLDYCTHAKSIKVLPLCLYNYRVLGTGLTATKNSADEYKKLADSYLSILNRENNNCIDKVYIPVIAETIYTAAMNHDSPLYAFSRIKQMKNVSKNGHIDKVSSIKIKFIASMPIFLELIWWLCYRVKNSIVCFLKR